MQNFTAFANIPLRVAAALFILPVARDRAMGKTEHGNWFWHVCFGSSHVLVKTPLDHEEWGELLERFPKLLVHINFGYCQRQHGYGPKQLRATVRLVPAQYGHECHEDTLFSWLAALRDGTIPEFCSVEQARGIMEGYTR